MELRRKNMKLSRLIFISALLFSSSAQARVYTPEEISKHVGYSSIYEHLGLDSKLAISVNAYAYPDGYTMQMSAPFVNYTKINRWLRGLPIDDFTGGSLVEKIKQVIQDVDFVIQQSHQLPQDLILFRGTNLAWRKSLYEVGDEFSDLAYISSSLDYQIAGRFMNAKDLAVIYVIYSDHSFHGLWMSPVEKEVLLPRNTVFRVMKSIPFGGWGKVTAQIIQLCPATGCAKEIPEDRGDVLEVLSSLR